jgi:hypothetical protein
VSFKKNNFQALSRHLSTKPSAVKNRGTLVVGTVLTALTGYGIYKYKGSSTKDDLLKIIQNVVKAPVIVAAVQPASQPSVSFFFMMYHFIFELQFINQN